MSSALNVERMMRELSAILSAKHGVKVTITATKKKDVRKNGNGMRDQENRV